jgi:hypothetical protein
VQINGPLFTGVSQSDNMAAGKRRMEGGVEYKEVGEAGVNEVFGSFRCWIPQVSLV